MSTVHSQQVPKRPKMTSRPDVQEYFRERVEYKRDASPDSVAFRYYNAAERVHGRSMEEWIRPVLSMTTFRADGRDWAGKPTFDWPWNDGSISMENYKRTIKAGFELCSKLGLKYWSAFDSDLVPFSKTLEEDKQKYDDISDFLYENCQKTNLKPMWIAADIHSHSRYALGVSTSQNPNTFYRAATQIKRSLELAHKLDSEGFLIWPLREQASSISDMEQAMKRFAHLMQMTSHYKYQIGFRGQLLVMPCDPSGSLEGQTGRFMWDGMSCLLFLKRFNLEKNYKIVIPPGNDMIVCNFYKMLGGVDINDFTKCDNIAATMSMKNIMDQGTVLSGGTSLRISACRRRVCTRDLQAVLVARVDWLARALRAAARINSDHQARKYSEQGFSTHYDSRLNTSDMTLEECEEQAKKAPGSTADTTPHQSQFLMQHYWDQPYQC